MAISSVNPLATHLDGQPVAEDALTEAADGDSGLLTIAVGVDFHDFGSAHATAYTFSKAGGWLGGTLVPVDIDIDDSGAESQGSPNYTYQVNQAAVQSLREGQTASETFTITASDGTGERVQQTVTVTVTGTKDGPVLQIPSATPTALPEHPDGPAVPDGQSLTIADFSATGDAPTLPLDRTSGNLTVPDVDVGDTLTVAARATVELLNASGERVPGFVLPAGAASLTAPGAISFLPATQASTGGTMDVDFTYTPAAANLDFLAQGEALRITYPVLVNDGLTSSDAVPVTVTIRGTPDGPDIHVAMGDSTSAAWEGTNAGLTDTWVADADPGAAGSGPDWLIGGTPQLSGYDVITDFEPGVDSIKVNGGSTVAADVSMVDGDDSSATIGGLAVSRHSIVDGIVMFHSDDGTHVGITSEADLAAALEYLQLNDLGNAGTTVALTGNIGGVDHTWVFTQSSDAGADNRDVLVDLVGVQADGLTTDPTQALNTPNHVLLG